VHLQEQDPRGALLVYLLPLIDSIGDRGWSLAFHVYQDKDESGRWPGGRAWGPTRSPAWLRRRLLAEFEAGAGKADKRRFRDVLMCVEGRHAGAILDAQLGLMRFDAPWQHEGRRDADARPAHLLIRFVAREAELAPDAWATAPLKVERPLTGKTLDATPKRAHFQADGTLSGSITTDPVRLRPSEFWSRVEQVMFAPLVARAFTMEDD